MTVQNNLRVLMAQHEYNIKDVHEKTGLSRRTIAKLYHKESSTVSFDTIDKLCDLFDCDIGDLLYIEKEQKENR